VPEPARPPLIPQFGKEAACQGQDRTQYDFPDRIVAYRLENLGELLGRHPTSDGYVSSFGEEGVARGRIRPDRIE
jgi:hypothetical protein